MATINTNVVTLTVTNPPPAVVASATISLVSSSVNVGQPDAATVQLQDANGNPITELPANASITYSSGDSTIATIVANGNPGNPLQAQINTLKAGQVAFSATIDQ